MTQKSILKVLESHTQMGKGNFRKKRLIGVCAFFLLLLGAGYVMKVRSLNTSTLEISDYVVKAESGSLPGLISASGELRAVRSVNVSPDRQGLLEELYVEEGDRVKQGQLLARMDDGDYLFRLEEIRAEYQKQKAAFERRQMLLNEGAISVEQHDEYRNRFLSSKARLEQREEEGRELMVLAPFSGVITTRYAEPGAFVAPSTRASSIAGSTSSSILELSQGMEVVAKVPESDIGRIQLGQNVTIRVDPFPDERFKAIVNEIAPRASKTDNVISFEVTLGLTKPSEKLRIGMTTDVEFQTGKTDISTLVPTVAIVTENGQPGVLVVGEKNQPRFQKIELGTSSGSKTAIVKGLEPGDQIFVDLPPWAKKRRE